MPIVSSKVASVGTADKLGRSWITEQHLDQFGNDHPQTYLAAPGTDTAAVCAARDELISADMAAAEIAANVQQGMTMGAAAQLTFNETTIAQNLQALAAEFPSADPTAIASMTAFVASLPEATLASDFGLSSAQIAAIQSGATTLTATIQAAAANLQTAIQSGGGT